MASRGWYAEKMTKLKKCKVAEMKERNAIEAIDCGHFGIVYPTKEQEKEQLRKDIAWITLKNLGYDPEKLLGVAV